MRFIIPSLILLQFLLPRVSEASVVVEGFESTQQWEIKEWGDGAELVLSSEHVTEGKQSLEIRLDPKNKKADNKGLFLRRGFSGRPENLQTLEIDLYNGLNQPIEFALALEADEYYEAPRLPLQPGWNRNIRLDLQAKTFKSASSNWEYKIPLKKGAAIGNILFIIYGGAIKEGKIWIDNVRTREWGNTAGLFQGQAIASALPGPIQVLSSPARVARGQRFEASFNFSGSYRNPYDPKEISVDGLLTSPSGKRMRMPAFLASGEVSLKNPVQNPLWKLRISPSEEGLWSYQVLVNNKQGERRSKPLQFVVDPAEFSGFLRVDPEDKHYFSFEDGTFYYPIGQNVGWDSDENYQKIFAAMSAAGENWTRVWMSNWSFGLEWKEMGFFRGLGNYNLPNAERLDKLLDLAAKHGIYMQLVFDFHGALSSKVNAEWANNPYNKVNGGLLAKADDFWTDLKARELYKRRLRYIVARWGYSPNIMAWEFFNEINFSDNFAADKETAWLKEMSLWLKNLDPHNHMITTSYYDYYNKQTYELPTIDFTQYHAYQKRVTKTMQTIVERFRKFNKPFFFAEFGNNSKDGVDDADKKGVFIHAGIWTQAMQPVGGNAMPWWWNTHIAPNDLYYHFKALSAFLKGLDRRGKDWQTVREEWVIQRRLGLNEKLVFQGLRSPEVMIGWIADSRAFLAEDGGSPKDWEKIQFKVDWPEETELNVEYWDTIRGEKIAKLETKPVRGKLVLTLPTFRNDIAFKVIRKNTQAQLTGSR